LAEKDSTAEHKVRKLHLPGRPAMMEKAAGIVKLIKIAAGAVQTAQHSDIHWNRSQTPPGIPQ
jgi:hypothetical protein